MNLSVEIDSMMVSLASPFCPPFHTHMSRTMLARTAHRSAQSVEHPRVEEKVEIRCPARWGEAGAGLGVRDSFARRRRVKKVFEASKTFVSS